MKEKKTRHESGYLDVGDLLLHYITCGEGEPFILLHGNGQSISAFRRQLAFFSRYFYCVAIDSRGHGKSINPSMETDIGYDVMARDLLQVMDHLHIQRAHLLGWSDGGITGLLFASAHSDRVLSLCMMGANFDISGLKRYVRFGILAAYYVTLPFVRQFRAADRHNKRVSMMMNQPTISERQLKNIQAPVLIISAKRDFVQLDHTKNMADTIKNSEMLILDRANHFAPIWKEKSFNMAVLAFIRRIQANA